MLYEARRHAIGPDAEPDSEPDATGPEGE